MARVCIVGAGVSGLATAYALQRLGVSFDCFEAGSQACGLWRYQNDSGMSAVYSSLKTNTSAPNMTLFGYELPELGRDYLTHRQVVTYLESFVDRSGLRPHLTLATRVTSVEPEGAGFRVEAASRSGRVFAGYYDAVVIAHGRNWSPEIPRLPGSFTGRFLHALEYKTPEILEGQRVVVMGFGNTGADIAVDAAACASQVILSTQSGGHLSFRYSHGRPVDQIRKSWANRLPHFVRRELARLRLRRRGLSQKVTESLEQGARFRGKPPVINDNIAALIDSGAIEVCRQIVRTDGRAVHFADGSQAEADVIIAATGYATCYPFFSQGMMQRNENFRDRYWRVVAPGQPGLYFVGHAAVVGPVFPVLEEQARWVAGLVAGRCKLPAKERMWRIARRQSARNARICCQATRGEDTVEAYPYIAALKRLSRGANFPRPTAPSRLGELPQIHGRDSEPASGLRDNTGCTDVKTLMAQR
jgi:cation diffusion facilitator CzcD-associated flavoprotein CzcO